MSKLSSRVIKIIIIFCLAVVIGLFLVSVFEKDFDAEDWKNNELTRYEMVDDLVESQILNHLTKAEVLQILGEPNKRLNSDKEMFLYKLGSPPSFFNAQPEQLLILFVDQKVDKVTFASD